MFDAALRPHKEALLAPVARRVAERVAPGWLTLGGIILGVGAAVAAGGGLRWPSLVLWVVSRVLDGLDGVVARHRDAASDLGGYLDMIADAVVYAAVPIGVAAAAGGRAWISGMVLIGAFYVNALAWAYLAAVVEKHGAGAARAGLTSIVMPAGLVEGAETLVLYTLMLAVPSHATVWFISMTVLVAMTTVQRVWWAARTLRKQS